MLKPVTCGLILVLFAASALANDQVRQRIEALHAGYPVSALGERLLARQALSNFYEDRGYALAWERVEDRNALVAAIENVSADGLIPTDYHFAALKELMSQPLEDLQLEELIDLELLLSDGFLMLGSHLLEGKVNPETIDVEWVANRRQRLLAPVLTSALQAGDVAAAIDGLRPAHAGYHALVQARKELAAELSGQEWHLIASGPAIKAGTRDERMPAIRSRLDLTVEGQEGDTAAQPDEMVYDPALVFAVKQFQARHGLEADGVVGRATLAALNISPEMRLHQIDLNLERWRWLPDDLGETHVMVNIAAFELKLVDRGQEILRQRVIVGRPFRQTPVFSDRIRYLVINPTWTVPRKLMVQDQLPEVIRDASYLERLGFHVYQGWGANRQLIDPATVDWSSLSARNFPYQLVQQPGPLNALGQIKFMFPNKFDVYLHDTPARGLFGKTERSFSSGCIRVEDPLELARLLLASQADWSGERIQQTVASGQLQTVLLKKPVPVHLEYWTAWADEAGQVQFRNDIYSRDQRLLAALRTPSSAAVIAVASRQ
ncbi:murein L,D-transpeptidase [Marinobacter sp.]|uniref:L,D-transpeptidase family protein n=1 Tax=Marinobacter sp. TaxID=50741 RepID=UPI0038513D68